MLRSWDHDPFDDVRDLIRGARPDGHGRGFGVDLNSGRCTTTVPRSNGPTFAAVTETIEKGAPW